MHALVLLVACNNPQPPPSASPPAEAEPAAPQPVEAIEAIEAVDAEEETKPMCNVSAYVEDPDPAGLNVRDAPTSKGSKVLGALPSTTQVDLIEAKDGWFRLSKAIPVEGDGRALPQEGWVFGKLLRVGVRNYGPESDYLLHAEPTADAPHVGDPGSDASLRLVGCRGDWIQVEHAGKTGWLSPEAQCASAVTNCS